MLRLPNLESLSRSENHIVLLFDGSENSTCYLGLGSQRSLVIGGNAVTLNVIDSFENFVTKGEGCWTFGWLGYELKNSIFELNTERKNSLDLPDLAWWEPEVVIKWGLNKKPEVIQGDVESELAKAGVKCIQEVGFSTEVADVDEMVWSWEKDEYLTNYEKVAELIQEGDVYELNLCQTLNGRAPASASWGLFAKLFAETKAPFSAYLQCGDSRIMCGSPERFLKREGNVLSSQPIKGTIKRGVDEEADLKLIESLRNCEKEKAENIMITDLVRNDLSRVATRGSVEVKELCEIYTFETVHQMISKIQCEIETSTGIAEILRATFPMGSMTGAPKLAAMKHIDKVEENGRGIYSGSIGYMSPNGNFDLNVIIRSLFHNVRTRKLAGSVGGAITSLSNAEDEFMECQLKAEALQRVMCKRVLKSELKSEKNT